jgi:hypothetical protein
VVDGADLPGVAAALRFRQELRQRRLECPGRYPTGHDKPVDLDGGSGIGTAMTEQAKPDPADVPNLKEFDPPAEETDAKLAQQPGPTPGEEHLKPVDGEG